jgi:S1-C subfamily serine protease
VGIGSLLTQEVREGEEEQGNVCVPIDLLDPILDNLLNLGESGQPPRPWLGLHAGETQAGLMVGSVTGEGPAERAGIQPDDLILEVAGERVRSLAALFRAVWRIGPAGVTVPITVARGGDLLRLSVVSGNRATRLKRPVVH